MLANKLRAAALSVRPLPEFVASASQQNTSSGGTLTINKPTGTVEGDLMIAVMAADGDARGWTDATFSAVADQGATRPTLRVAYKVAGPSEPTSYSFTTSAADRRLGGCIITYRHATYDTIGGFASGQNPLILPGVIASESQSILIASGAKEQGGGTVSTPDGMTARVIDDDGTGPSYIVCDQTVDAGPTGTRSMTAGSGPGSAGIMLVIKPA